MKKIVLFLGFIFSMVVASAQGLKDVIVEKYYTASSSDRGDSTSGILPKGFVVYRVFVDLQPGYKLQAVYGVPEHELRFQTSTRFFNNKYSGAINGSMAEAKYLKEKNYAFDSWLSMGMASNEHVGVLRARDKDGSVIKRKMFFSDGLKKGSLPKHIIYGDINLNPLGQSDTTSLISSKNGSIAVLGGVENIIDGKNTILIAQLTTDGVFSFELNLQIGGPKGEVENYVAKNPGVTEIKFDALTFNKKL
jgi:hypothetical protein